MISKTKIIFLTLLIITASIHFLNAQNCSIRGQIVHNEKPLDWVSIQVENTQFQTISDENGMFRIDSMREGKYSIHFHSLGFKEYTRDIELDEDQTIFLKIDLFEDRLNLDEVVISGTRYELDKRESPVIVNVLKPRTLEASQSMAISEGLNYQPGVRIENNCQNCGFTQVRLNGLDGAYSQILINNRAVFSALNAVYGLDQIPTNIVERIEIVRGGGSALYGSNAIAGTINIITREPLFNAWRAGTNLALIDGEKVDNTSNFNASLVNNDLSAGSTVFGMKRLREAYDANADGFSEITQLSSITIGSKSFIKPTKSSKLNFDFSVIQEDRRGGDQFNLEPHFTDITEQLEHNTLFYGLTYDQFMDKHMRHKLTTYISGQLTKRDSYYGGLGGGRTLEDSLLALNAYGNTMDQSTVSGLQYSLSFKSSNVLIMGIEHQNNMVEDEISGYKRLVDQDVNTLGFYSQFEWKLNPKLKLLSGLRFDFSKVKGRYELGDINRNSDVDLNVLSPRITALYNAIPQVQFRAGYARGFRAPQAFNEDLHISSVGGEPRFVILSQELEKELSDSYTLSANYSSNESKIQTNFILEGFYTTLRNPFTIVNMGLQLSNGSIVEELKNGEEAIVRGVNLEANVSPHHDIRFENGLTIQESIYKSKQVLFQEDENVPESERVETTRFLRTPNVYGYSTFNWSPIESFSTDITATYTGEMIVPKVISSNGRIDLGRSNPFIDTNLKFSYHFDLKANLKLEFALGIQNIFNAYQNDFAEGAQRDSDYIYGPARPRTYFFSINLGNYH